MYKLKTVDVWDTLLRRDCHPECIKLATAKHLQLGWFDKLKPKFAGLGPLYSARLNAESKLAANARDRGLDDEYEITQVFHAWLDEVFEMPPNEAFTVALAEFEIQWEIKRAFVDSGIVDFVQNVKADRTIFLSDFYMTGDKLSSLLAAKGLSHLVDEGISSCDVGVNKRSGRLFHHVHELHGISPDQHYHIGDNLWSDVESPRKIGINAEHYLPVDAHAERIQRESLFSSRAALFEHILIEGAQQAVFLSKEKTNEEEAAFCIGTDAAPLFVGFALWIAESALYKKLDRIFFLTREGDFFQKVYSEIFPENIAFGHKLPPATLLEVSRMATFAASMREVSIEEMARVWSLFKVQSISGLFATLSIDIKRFSILLEKVGLREADVVKNPLNNFALRRLFEEPEFLDAVRESIDRQKGLLEDYLRENGICENENVGIVDIGWRGTIQDNLAILKPDIKFHGMYLGLRKFINRQPNNTSKAAYSLNENLSTENINLFENFSLLEMLCVSDKGSVIGYERIDKKVFAIRESGDMERFAFNRFTKHFQEGVLAASRHWSDYVEKYVIEAEEFRESSLKVWNTLRRSPSQELVDVFIQTPQHDLFGYGEMFHRKDFPSLSTILMAVFLKSKRQILIEYIRRVQWIAPIQQAQDIGYVHRMLLVAVFRLANLLKITRIRTRRLMNSH